MDPQILEEAYQEYITDLQKFLPDGVLVVDMDLLQELQLLNPEAPSEDPLTHHFYVIESSEKLTLFNTQFALWITPHIVGDQPATLTLIARCMQGLPRLEMAFSTQGVYNHSNLVLKILEKFIKEIEETESALTPWNT